MKTSQKGSVVVILSIIIVLLVVAFGIYIYYQNLPAPTLVVTSQQIGTNSQSATTSNQNTTSNSVDGMQQYTDSSFGFSFWYPNTWVVTQKQVADPTDNGWLQGGTVVKQFTVVKNGNDPLHSGLTIQEFYSPTFTITELGRTKSASPVGVDQSYFFNSNTHTWMYENLTDAPNGNQPAGTITAADVSNNTMGGLHMLSGAERFGADTIVPLSASDFLIISKNNPTDLPDQNLLVKTILALNPKVATPVGQAEQTQTIQAEANAYGVQSTPTQAISGWPTYTEPQFGFSFQYPATWQLPIKTISSGGVTLNFGDQGLFIWDNLISTYGQNMTANSVIQRQSALPNAQISSVRIAGKSAVTIAYANSSTEDVFVPDSQGNVIDIQRFTNDHSGYSVDSITFSQILASFNIFSPAITGQSSTLKIYSDPQLGISFQYPTSLNNIYASLDSVSTFSGTTNIDSNGCYEYPGAVELSRPAQDKILTLNGIPFCLSSAGDPGAGQLYTDYDYTTLKNGTYITLDFSVHTPNGCGALEGTPNYQTCESINTESTIIQPIQQSAGTLLFTK